MAYQLRVAQAEVSFQQFFGEPDFKLLDSDVLHRFLYSALAPRGLRLADITVDSAGGSLAAASLTLSLPALRTVTKVFLDRAEVLCFELLRERVRTVGAIAVDVSRALNEQRALKSYTVSSGLHGTVEGISTKDFIRKLVPSPPADLGPVLGSGVVFYFGPSDDVLTSSVAADLSVVINDGIFVRTQCVWDAAKLRVDELSDRAEEYVGRLLGGIDLRLSRD